jgi:hypothetical protein
MGATGRRHEHTSTIPKHLVHGIGTPEKPIVGELSFEHQDDALAVDRELVHIATAAPAFHSIDVSRVDRPLEIGSSVLRDRVRSILAAGGKAFVAAISTGVDIFDVAEPASPEFLATIAEPERIADMDWLEGAGAHQNTIMLGGDTGVSFVSIADPSNPREVVFFRNRLFDVSDCGSAARTPRRPAAAAIAASSLFGSFTLRVRTRKTKHSGGRALKDAPPSVLLD